MWSIAAAEPGEDMSMKKTILLAAILLVVQIGLVVALTIGTKDTDNSKPNMPLLGFTPDAVTGLTITGPEKDQVVLQKNGNAWTLPDFFGAPASAEQVTALLTRLAEFKQGFAVATTKAAAKRFKVADDTFERHVVIKAGDKEVGDLYVGTSPGFRQIHVRKAGSDAVVAVELSTFELETGAEKWLDKNMFRIKEEDIERISFPDFVLEKKDKGWQLADLKAGEVTDAKAASDLVDKVSDLMVQSVVAPKEAEPLFAKPEALHYSITRKGGGVAEFRFAKAEGDYYVLKQSERNLYCKVHNLLVSALLKVNRESLIAKAKAAAPEKTDAKAITPEKTAEGPAKSSE